jgi:hypothetical protein
MWANSCFHAFRLRLHHFNINLDNLLVLNQGINLVDKARSAIVIQAPYSDTVNLVLEFFSCAWWMVLR